MPLPIGQQISVPVEVVCTSLVPPVISHGRVTHYDGETFECFLEDPVPPLEPGSQVILDLTAVQSARVIATVSEVQGTRLCVIQKSVNEPDKRVFPRLYGNVSLRYRLASHESEPAVQAWLSGGLEAAGEHEWHTPDSFMNFSVTGLKFEDAKSCVVGDVLLAEFGVPTSENRFRSTARVIRVFPKEVELPEDQETEATHNIALEFLEMPKEGREALSEFTLLIQGVLL